MNCIKCNSEMPDGAKFCTVCGAPAADSMPSVGGAAAARGNFCQKCGLELPANAKFCSVCGAPSGAQKPEGGDTMAAVQPIPPISLEKPVSDSDRLVSAMNSANSAAPSPAAYSAPAESVSAPVNAGLGAAASVSGGTSYIPQQTVPAQAGDFAGLGGAAAAAVSPVRKKSVVKPIVISVCAVLGAALIGLGVFFFVNKAAFLSLFMGKPGYAAMIEGNSIKQAASQIDTESISSGVKAVSGLYSSLASVKNDYSDSFDSIDSIPSFGTFDVSAPVSSRETLDTMAVKDADRESVDVKAMIEALNQALTEAYGANCAEAKLGMKLELTDTTIGLMGSSVDRDELNEVLDLINSTTFTFGVAASENTAAATGAVKSGDFKADVKVVIEDNGDTYISFPFGSAKSIKIRIPTEEGAASASDETALELDPKEITRLIEKIVAVYVETYKENVVSMESGELEAAGVSASGQLIKSEIRGEKLSAFFEKIGETIAEDDYFRGKIVDYAKDIGEDYSESDYKDAIMKAFEIRSDDDNAIIIYTVINNNGDILGKSVVCESATDEASAAFIENKKQAAFEFKYNDVSVTMNEEKDDETSGVCTVKVSTGKKGETYTVKVKYSGVKTVKWNGRDTAVGTYEVQMVLPKDFTETNNLSTPSGIDLEALVQSAKLTFGTSVESESTITGTFALSIPQYGEIGFTETLTVRDGADMLKLPAGDIIDLSDYFENPDGGEVSDENMSKALELIADIRDSVKKQGSGAIIDYVVNALDDLLEEANQADFDKVFELMDNLTAGYYDVSEMPLKYGVYDAALSKKAEALAAKYDDLNSELLDKYYDAYSLTPEEYNSFKKRFDALEAEKAALEAEFAAAMDKPVAPNGASSADINFSSLDALELMQVVTEYTLRYATVTMKIDNSDARYAELLENGEKTFNQVKLDIDTLSKQVDKGNLNISTLRTARKSAKAFAEAVEALETANQTMI